MIRPGQADSLRISSAMSFFHISLCFDKQYNINLSISSIVYLFFVIYRYFGLRCIPLTLIPYDLGLNRLQGLGSIPKGKNKNG